MSTNTTLAQGIEQLKSAVGLLNVADLQDLSTNAVRNLKALMSDPQSAFAQDPALSLEAAKTLAKINTDTVEAQRRVIDTLIKYHTALQQREVPPADNLLPPENQEVDQGSANNSVFN